MGPNLQLKCQTNIFTFLVGAPEFSCIRVFLFCVLYVAIFCLFICTSIYGEGAGGIGNVSAKEGKERNRNTPPTPHPLTPTPYFSGAVMCPMRAHAAAAEMSLDDVFDGVNDVPLWNLEHPVINMVGCCSLSLSLTWTLQWPAPSDPSHPKGRLPTPPPPSF